MQNRRPMGAKNLPIRKQRRFPLTKLWVLPLTSNSAIEVQEVTTQKHSKEEVKCYISSLIQGMFPVPMAMLQVQHL